MLDWTANIGKPVRQRTTCQKPTKFKAAILPLNMYATSVKPTGKIRLGRKAVDCPANNTESSPETLSDHDKDKQSEDSRRQRTRGREGVRTANIRARSRRRGK